MTQSIVIYRDLYPVMLIPKYQYINAGFLHLNEVKQFILFYDNADWV